MLVIAVNSVYKTQHRYLYHPESPYIPSSGDKLIFFIIFVYTGNSVTVFV